MTCEVSEMGLQFAGSVLLPFLKIGAMNCFLYCVGMVPPIEDFCQRMVSGLHRDIRQFLSILAGISQSGADEFAFNSDIASIISLGVTSMSVILEVLFFSVQSSTYNTASKNFEPRAVSLLIYIRHRHQFQDPGGDRAKIMAKVDFLAF